MPPSNGAARYRVHFPQPLLHQLRVWAEEAKQRGEGAAFLSALREIREELRHHPKEWGDRLRRYATIQAVEMRGMIPKWLFVWYGVNDAARQVIVRHLLPAPGSPLSPPATAGGP